MRHLALSLLFCVCVTCALAAQVVDTSVCDVLANPQSFDGKIVRIKGTVIAGFDEFFIKGMGCNQPVNGIWLAYPEGTKAKAGPVAFLQLQIARNNPSPVANPDRAAVKLEKNKDFKQFDSLLSTPYKAGGMCLGCTRYRVNATLVGRLDGSKHAGIVRDSNGRFISADGFGNLNLYKARLVVQAVSDVAPEEIDYSKTSAVTKDDSARDAAGGDPVAAAHQAARAFGAESAAGQQVERAAAAYGKEGEDNGVNIGFGVSNEASKNDPAKGDHDSPDGLLFNCTFDMDRLKGEALTRAISHIGTHIADLRDAQSAHASDPYKLEYRAWQTTALSSVAAQQKTLTAPGGYLIWNSSWAAGDRDKLMDEAISNLIANWLSLSKSAQ